MRASTVAAASLALLPMLLGAFVLASGLPAFGDPCHRWGQEPPVTAEPTDACPEVTGTSETRVEAAVRLAVLGVGMPLAAAAGAGGLAWREDGLVAGGVLALLAYAIPLGFGWGWMAPLLGAGGLVLARRLEGPIEGRWGTVMLGIGALAGLGSLAFLGSLAYAVLQGSWSVVPFTIIATVLWGAVATFAWLPQAHFGGVGEEGRAG